MQEIPFKYLQNRMRLTLLRRHCQQSYLLFSWFRSLFAQGGGRVGGEGDKILDSSLTFCSAGVDQITFCSPLRVGEGGSIHISIYILLDSHFILRRKCP